MTNMKEEPAKYTIGAILARPIWFKSVFRKLEPAFFEDELLRETVVLMQQYFRAESAFPNYETLMLYVESEGVELSEDLGNYIKKLHKIGTKLFRTSDFEAVVHRVRKHFDKFISKRLKQYAGTLFLDGLEKGMGVAAILRNIREEMGNQTKEDDLGSIISEDVKSKFDAIFKNELEVPFPTGFKHLDKTIEGGLARGELGVFMAAPKIGKSWVLMNIGARAVSRLDQFVVVHYTLEMSEKRLRQRYYSFFAKQNIRKVNPKDYDKTVKAIEQALRGKLILKGYPTRSCGYSDIVSHMDTLVANNIRPDLVIVDYGDIMLAERRKGERRAEEASCFEDLRKIAQDYDVPVWTATQASRMALSKPVVRMEHIAESFEKVQIADVVISISQTEKEKEADRWRFFLAAVRNSPSNAQIHCDTDLSRGVIKTIGYTDKPKKKKKEKEPQVDEEALSAAAQKMKERQELIDEVVDDAEDLSPLASKIKRSTMKTDED